MLGVYKSSFPAVESYTGETLLEKKSWITWLNIKFMQSAPDHTSQQDFHKDSLEDM